jgi:cell division septum initiation protein DivIVA
MNEEVEVTPTIQHPVLTAQNERIETLMKANEELAGELAAYKNKDEYVSAQLTKWSDKYRKAEYALTDLLKELITDEDIILENAQRIADIFDNISLTKRISIRYNVSVGVELEVPLDADEDEVADQVYCDRVSFETYESNYEVLEVDFEVEDWNVVS